MACVYEVYRARCLRDAFLTHHSLPDAPLPIYLSARARAKAPLPIVTIESHEKGPWEWRAGRRGEKRHVDEEKKRDAERTLAVDYVTRYLDKHLFHELMTGMNLLGLRETGTPGK